LVHRLPLPRTVTDSAVLFDAIVVSQRFDTIVGWDMDPANARFERRAILRELADSLVDDGKLILWGWDHASAIISNVSMADTIAADLDSLIGFSSVTVLMRFGRTQDDFGERLGVAKVVRMGGGYPVWIVSASK